MTIRSVLGRHLPGLLTALLLVPPGARAQSWQWASQSTAATQDAHVNRVATDGQGNTYVLGEFAGTVSFGTTQLTSSAGTSDAFVAKCSPTGQWLWARSMGTTGIEYGYGLAVDAAGNAYVGGGYGGGGCGGSYTLRFGSTISISSVISGQCGGTPAVAYLAKISANGTWQWAVGGNWVSYIHDVALSPDGSVTAVGACNRSYTLGSLTSNALSSTVTDDAFAARFTPDGQGMWFARALVNGRATGVGIDADGNAYVCGRYRRSSTMSDPTFGSTVLTGICDHNWFLAKVDPSGEWMWATKAGSGGRDVPADVAVDAAGNAFVTGVAAGAISFGPSILPTTGSSFGVLAKCSPTGQWQWARAVLNCTEGPNNVNVDAAGNPYIVGGMNGSQMTFGPHTITEPAGTYLYSFMAKANASGDWQWARGFQPEARAVNAGPGGTLRVAGSFSQNRQLDNLTLTSNSYYDNTFVGTFTPPAAPTFATLAPASGAAGSTVTVTGTRFNSTIGVKIGTKDATFTIISPTEVRVVVPAGAVTAPITVFTATGSVATTPFTVLPTSISSFAPTVAHVGATVTIDGAGFVGVTAVKFGTKLTTFSVVSPTRLTAVVPTGAITAKISVTAGTTGTSLTNFTVQPPTATAFAPASGQVGATVTIAGTGFTAATAVKFGTKLATFTVVSATQITAVVPVGAVSGAVAITGQGGTGLSTVPFAVLPPTVTSFSPTGGQAGTLVTIDGTGFTGATSVKFGIRTATGVTVVSATRITALVPAGATTGLVSVVGTGGTGASAASFAIIPPAISSFSPTTGPVGTTVTITGTGLVGATGVKFNGVLATTFTALSATQVRAVVPAGATMGRLTVLAYGGTTALSTASFTVTGARPAAVVTAETPVLNIYPNPAHGTLQVRVPEGARAVEVLDRTGAVVRTQAVVLPEATELLLPLEGLLPGVYTVRCGALTRRLVVE